MKKIILIFLSFFTMFIINNTNCYAVHSHIYKNIKTFTSDDYDIYLQSQLIENQIFNYYSNKKIDMLIFKHIKSERYKNYIQNVIREYYPPPMWRPESINSIIDSAMSNNGLWIQEKAYLDFRNRTVTLYDESLWKTEGKNEQVIINLTPEATFHMNFDYVDMDNSPESGSIANASIDFLESIKDIYFDENKRKEHESKGISSKNFDYYWISKYDKWEKCTNVVDSDKSTYTKFTTIYVDAKSVRWVDKYLEGWIKFDFDLEKYKSEMTKAGKNASEVKLPKSALYYARFDNNNKQFFIIAGYEISQDNSVNKYVLNEAETWTYKDAPDVVACVLNQVADIYNNHRGYW